MDNNFHRTFWLIGSIIAIIVAIKVLVSSYAVSDEYIIVSSIIMAIVFYEKSTEYKNG